MSSPSTRPRSQICTASRAICCWDTWLARRSCMSSFRARTKGSCRGTWASSGPSAPANRTPCPGNHRRGFAERLGRHCARRRERIHRHGPADRGFRDDRTAGTLRPGNRRAACATSTSSTRQACTSEKSGSETFTVEPGRFRHERHRRTLAKVSLPGATPAGLASTIGSKSLGARSPPPRRTVPDAAGRLAAGQGGFHAGGACVNGRSERLPQRTASF